MPLSLTLASLWVIAVAALSFLPMRYQYAPGLTLLILFLPLVAFVAYDVGWVWVLAVLFALGSMFRRPLRALFRHLTRRIRGEV